MAHSYSHLFGLPTTGLRFFTVYGPWGRPDMAPMLFTKAILAGEPIEVFNHGDMRARLHLHRRHRRRRACAMLERPPRARADGGAPYAIYNIGNHEAVELETFIATLERLLGRTRDPRLRSRCSRATCRRRTRRSTGCARRPDSRRARRSPTASRASWRGTATTIRRLTPRDARAW